MNIRYRVTLSLDDRSKLEELVRAGEASVRMIKRAQVLLSAADGVPDEVIAATVRVGTSTVYRLKQRFVEEGVDRALNEAKRPRPQRKLAAHEEALLVAVACSDPPSGRARWTLKLLADEMVTLTSHERLSAETVRRRLAELDLKPWQKKMWCIPKIDAEYVTRMEDVLALYEEAADPRRPVVCFDETPRQLIGEERVPVRAEPGKRARFDFEYVRNGTANVFMFVDVNRPWRHAKVTDQRTCLDFAACMRDLVDEHYPNADCIRVVLDNLSAHTPSALYQAFEPAEARRILSKLEFHFTPKHASWLNMVEIEIGVMAQQCLTRRIGDKKTLTSEISKWERRRNGEGARIRWMFTVARAREKLGRAYPVPAYAQQRAAA